MCDHWDEFGWPVAVGVRQALIFWGAVKPKPKPRISEPNPGGGDGFDDFAADMQAMFPDGGG